MGQGQSQWLKLATQSSSQGTNSGNSQAETRLREDQDPQNDSDAVSDAHAENQEGVLGALVTEALSCKWISSIHFDTALELDNFLKVEIEPKEEEKKQTLQGAAHQVLWMSAESLTALNRISSLLRRPLYEVLDILQNDLTGENSSRKQIAKLIAFILANRLQPITKKLLKSETILTKLKKQFEKSPAHWAQGTRNALDYAIEQLKTVAAFATTIKKKESDSVKSNPKATTTPK